MTDNSSLHAGHIIWNATTWLAEDIDKILNSEGFSKRAIASINEAMENGTAVVGRRLDRLVMSARLVVKDSDTAYIIRNNLAASEKNGMLIIPLIENYLTFHYIAHGWDDVRIAINESGSSVHIIVMLFKNFGK